VSSFKDAFQALLDISMCKNVKKIIHQTSAIFHMYTGNFQKNIISQIFHICIGFMYNVVCTNKSFKNGQEELNKETAFLLDLASHQFCFPPKK